MEYKKIKIGICALALTGLSYFAGKASVDDPKYFIDIWRTQGDAYMVRISDKNNWENRLEITNKYSAKGYMVGGKANERRDFERESGLKIGIHDLTNKIDDF